MDTQKDQIIERLNQATNVLVTVSNNPSVDQLAAAIGITLLLNKLGKHATAVFSGHVPSTIEFLQPEKTLEKNTDSLRDFIIALDKSKADKLRYKVEDQMVKIFITPYRTSITDKDLEYSQGDFNVEVVLAIGVNEQKDLDQAITTHGRILHDATVIGANTQGGANLGAINWVVPSASSLSEMMVELGVALKEDVLDEQMATAFLTGIVAETERFSNEKTSSETMQVSAKLMTAGANQQLVASKLQASVAKTAEHMQTDLPGGVDDELPEVSQDSDTPTPEEAPIPSVDGALAIDHEEPKPLEEELDVEPEKKALDQIMIDEHGQFGRPGERDDIKQKVLEPLSPEPVASEPVNSRRVLEPPVLGGTLTANTVPEGLDPGTDPMATSTVNAPLLSHDSSSSTPPAVSEPLPQTDDFATATPPQAGPLPVLDPLPSSPPADPVVPSTPELGQSPNTLTDLERAVASPHLSEVLGQQPDAGEPDLDPVAPETPVNLPENDINSARDAVLEAVNSSPTQALEPVQSLNAQPMDLNLGDIPAVNTSPASAFADAAPPFAPANDATVASDPGLPPGLVPSDPGLPADSTAGDVTNPAAPPPVPPPMMPPVMPPSSADGNDSQSAV